MTQKKDVKKVNNTIEVKNKPTINLDEKISRNEASNMMNSHYLDFISQLDKESIKLTNYIKEEIENLDVKISSCVKKQYTMQTKLDDLHNMACHIKKPWYKFW